jgi:hypothetical protein
MAGKFRHRIWKLPNYSDVVPDFDSSLILVMVVTTAAIDYGGT